MQINGTNYTVGADPEVFMGLNGTFVSAHDKIPGNKQEPFPVLGGAVQVDGLAMEFNIDPAENVQEFKENLNVVQASLRGMIGDHEFLEAASVVFDEEFLKDIPDYSLELGCEADYNAWEMMENTPPEAASLMRTAGGHVHLGGFFTDDPFTPAHFKECARLARILDETLGVYSVLWDTDDQRRSMYGGAGSFRPKVYGMEYRTLSNSWIFREELVEFVYDAVEKALVKFQDLTYEPNSVVRSIINTSNRNSSYFKSHPVANSLVA